MNIDYVLSPETKPGEIDVIRITISQRWPNIPQSIVNAVILYATTRTRCGGFVMAVLANDLSEAVRRADQDSQQALPSIIQMLSAHILAAAWGSDDLVKEWLTPTKTKAEYPEHEKLGMIADMSQNVGEFMEWLLHQKEYVLFEHGEMLVDHGSGRQSTYEGMVRVNRRVEDLAGEFFGIDLKKLEAEKQQMLVDIRTARREGSA